MFHLVDFEPGFEFFEASASEQAWLTFRKRTDEEKKLTIAALAGELLPHRPACRPTLTRAASEAEKA